MEALASCDAQEASVFDDFMDMLLSFTESVDVVMKKILAKEAAHLQRRWRAQMHTKQKIHTNAHKCTQMHTNAHKCTQIAYAH